MIVTAAQDDVCRLAQNLARNCGYAVFPCNDDKTPACPHGFKNASTEPDRITRLWRDHPGPLIGVVTGPRSGISVLDIDQKHASGVAWWQDMHSLLLPTRVFRTRSGGLHLVMQHRDGVKNTQAKIALGVDTRGEGGYFIYWFAAGFECLDQSPPAPWPAWLLAETAPKRPTADDAGSRGGSWGNGFNGILRRLGNAREGERNAVLYWSACRLAERHIRQPEIEAHLLPIAVSIGLTDFETRRTIASAHRRAGA
jgi:hypothetical protein